ncbi:hypothetical protein [Methylophilus methylotrophus]|uniref:hypothetical protein n=1 Tax=Methylophilus methylotrophus TaxID=17 RepID=UPI00035E063D|nr:hypothetical protein [Methylophilus methylotrophus]
MNKNKKYHGYSKQQFLMCCAKNIILKVPYEQDYLLLNYGPMISEVLINYLRATTKDNLEMIYQNQFEFKMKFDELNNVFNYKFDYYH